MLGLGLNLTSITAALLDFVRSELKMWLPFEKSEILGEDVVVNGDFSTGDITGWTHSGGSVEVVDYDGKTDALHVNASTSNQGVYQNVLQANTQYLVKFDLKVISGAIFIGKSGNKVTGNTLSPSSWTPYEVNWTSDSDTLFRFYSSGAAAEFYVDNVSVQEVTQIAPDKSGNSNGATLYTGKALSFDGNNDYVDLGSQSMPNTSAATFSFWCNPTLTSSTGDRAVIRYGKSNVWFNDNNEIQVYPDIAGSVAQFTGLSDPSGKYQRFVVTISGTTTKLYIDGTLIGSATTPAISTTASASYIGQFDTNKFLPAKLSDVQLYDVAWSQADVTFDYNNPQHLVTDNSASTIALSNLKGYWHLSEGAGAINYDSSGESNNGTINGATWSLRQATIPQLGLMDWEKSTPVSDEITLISDPNDPSKDILDNDVRLREHSLNLDGSGYAKVDSDSSLNITNYSIDGWFYSTNNSSNYEAILTKLTQDNFEVYIRNSQLKYFNSTDSEKLLASISLNAWNYFCITESSGTLKCYINDDSTPKSSQTVTQKFENSGPVYIGSHQSGDYSNALIDDIRVYNSVLSAGEVLQNYKAGLSQHKPGSAFSDDFSSDYGL